MQEFKRAEEVIQPLGGDEALFEDLLIDLAGLEVQGWIESMIDFLAFDPRKDQMLPPNCIQVWRSFDPMKQEMTFLRLLGAVKALMEPPEESSVYVS